MHHFNLFAAVMATTLTSIFDMLVHLVGTGIIIISVIWSAYCLITYLIRRLSPVELPVITPAPAVPRPVEPAPATAAIPPQIVAVIAAAVQYMLGETHKIIAIKPQDTSWEKAGRQAVLTSHRIR